MKGNSKIYWYVALSKILFCNKNVEIFRKISFSFFKIICLASGVVLSPLPEFILYGGRAAGFKPKLVKLAALPHFQ
jgi:hypothetical protein